MVMCWVCVPGSCWWWCATTTSTQRDSSSLYWSSLGSQQGEGHVLSDMCNTRYVQRIQGNGILTLDWRGYRTPSLRWIPLGSRYGNRSLSRGLLRSSPRHGLGLFLMMGHTSNISYDLSGIGVRASGTHSQLWLFNITIVAIISTLWICNIRDFRLVLGRPSRDLQYRVALGTWHWTPHQYHPWRYSGIRSLE
jgi:hypothetical protein